MPPEVELADAIERARAERAALVAENAGLRAALYDANGICRSAYSIALRGGEQTNWSAFASRCRESLDRQHAVMYPPQEFRAIVPPVPAPPDPVPTPVAAIAPLRVGDEVAFATKPTEVIGKILETKSGVAKVLTSAFGGAFIPLGLLVRYAIPITRGIPVTDYSRMPNPCPDGPAQMPGQMGADDGLPAGGDPLNVPSLSSLNAAQRNAEQPGE